MKQTIPQILAEVRAENRAAGEAEPAKQEPKRRKPLRRISPKRRKLMSDVGPQRLEHKEQVGECMICRKPLPPEELDCDEIARGFAREACLTEWMLLLVSCRACHQSSQDWPITTRIAALLKWIGERACHRYNELRGTAQTHVTWTGVLTALEYAPGVKPVERVKRKRKKKLAAIDKGGNSEFGQ